jgi:hypothetical protein
MNPINRSILMGTTLYAHGLPRGLEYSFRDSQEESRPLGH